MRLRIWLLAALLFFGGCDRNDGFTPVYNVPEEIQPIIDAFITKPQSVVLTLP